MPADVESGTDSACQSPSGKATLAQADIPFFLQQLYKKAQLADANTRGFFQHLSLSRTLGSPTSHQPVQKTGHLPRLLTPHCVSSCACSGCSPHLPLLRILGSPLLCCLGLLNQPSPGLCPALNGRRKKTRFYVQRGFSVFLCLCWFLPWKNP